MRGGTDRRGEGGGVGERGGKGGFGWNKGLEGGEDSEVEGKGQ